MSVGGCRRQGACCWWVLSDECVWVQVAGRVLLVVIK